MSRTRVLYDGQCPLCQFSVRQLRRLDWLGRLEYLDARQPETFPADLPPLDHARLMEEMHVVTPDGSICVGFRGVRALAWRLPLLWPLAPLLYIPGVPSLGQWLYLRVAKNRFQIVPCKDGVCSLPGQGTPGAAAQQGSGPANPPPTA